MVYPALFAGQRFTVATAESMLPLWAGKTVTTDRASTTTVTADPELVLPVEANAEYTYSFYLRISGVLAAGIDINKTTPAGATGSYSCTRLSADQSSDTGSTRTSARINYNIETEFSPVSTSAHQVLEGTGRLITAGTAGNFSIEWAQNVSNATATSMHSDSWIMLRRVG